MSDRPRFKSCYHWDVLAPHGVLLLSERGQFVLRGRAYLLIAPFLDGEHTLDEIVTRLEGRLSEPEVLYAVQLLEQKGYVVRSGAPVPAAETAYWELLGAGADEAARRKSRATVALRALGGAPSAPLRAMLEELGIRTLPGGPSPASDSPSPTSDNPSPTSDNPSLAPGADIAVVLADDYLQEGLAELNREALDHGRPWMLVRPVGVEIWLGPVFVPGKTGCWACLSHNLAGHRKAEAYIRKRRGLSGPVVLARAALPSTVHAALGLAATEVARWVATGSSEALEGRVVVLDTVTLERTAHTLTRRPQCPACGDPGLVARGQGRPIALGPCPASFTADGGYRRAAPEEMLARHGHLVSPITGIVGHMVRLLHRSGSDLTVSYVADHNFAHVDEELFFLRESQRSRSGGKGKSDAQARASALGEAIERYSGVFQGDEARLRARLRDLGDAAIHPHSLLLFSERQYAERDRWNRGGSRYTRVPEPFDPEAEIDWSPVFPVRGGDARHVPTTCCYFGYGNHHPSPFASADSNGCAAGTTREEAVFQGLLELVERDATAIWWYSRARRPGVDLSTFGDPYYAALADYYRSIHRSFWALDLTHDLGIPTFAALSRRTDKKAEDIIFGLGSHPDPKIAMLRAVTELNQFLPAVISVTETSEQYNWSAEGVRFFKSATLDTDPYLAPDPSAPPRTLADHPWAGSGDVHRDLLACVDAIEARGHEVLALDQTRPDTGLAVVRVIVPGLRHMWARFAPGRLYDVPVQLGWLPRPLGEDELNPYPIFF